MSIQANRLPYKFWVLIPFFIFSGMRLVAQSIESSDTTIILISNLQVQIESTEALNDLYNFKFEKAEQQFRWFKQKYAWHPLPYFLLGLSEWWKIMPNPNDTSHDEKFLAYMDSTIRVAENLYKHYPAYKIESSFFLAAAYGFKGRLYSDGERANWGKAAAAGKQALRYLEECKEKEDLSPELLFGDALYNYFSVWVPENYPILKPMMWLFPKGDKELGLKQLNEVSYNAFYTRTEAMVWLMRIMSGYENNQSRAFQISQYLYETYPDNAYFHRYYVRMLYVRRMNPELEMESKKIIQNINDGKVGYEAVSGRYAAFYLARLYDGRENYEEATKHYVQSIDFAEGVDAEESGYYLYSLNALGEIYLRDGDLSNAKYYFEKVKDTASRKDEAHKNATNRLKQIKRLEKD